MSKPYERMVVCIIPLDDLEKQIIARAMYDMIKEQLKAQGLDMTEQDEMEVTDVTLPISLDSPLEPMEFALTCYNDYRASFGLMPLHKLPMGVKFKEGNFEEFKKNFGLGGILGNDNEEET